MASKKTTTEPAPANAQAPVPPLPQGEAEQGEGFAPPPPPPPAQSSVPNQFIGADAPPPPPTTTAPKTPPPVPPLPERKEAKDNAHDAPALVTIEVLKRPLFEGRLYNPGSKFQTTPARAAALGAKVKILAAALALLLAPAAALAAAKSGTGVPPVETSPAPAATAAPAAAEPSAAATAALQRHRAYERDRAAVRERHDAASGKGDLYNKWLDAPAQDERRKQFFRDILLFAEDAADPGLAVRLAHEYEEHHLAPGRPIEGAPTKAEIVALYKKHDRLHYLRHHSTKEEILALPQAETLRALDLIRDKRLGLSEEEVAAHTDDFRRRQVHTGELDRHYIAWARKRLAAMVTPVAVEWVEKEVKSHAALDLEYRNRKAVVTNWLATLQLLRELAGLESAPAAQRDTGGSPVSLAPGVSAPPSLFAAAAAKAAPLRDAGLTQEPPAPAKYSALWFARDRAAKDGTDAALARYYRLANTAAQ